MIRLGWKNLSESNTLAYNGKAKITFQKSLITGRQKFFKILSNCHNFLVQPLTQPPSGTAVTATTAASSSTTATGSPYVSATPHGATVKKTFFFDTNSGVK